MKIYKTSETPPDVGRYVLGYFADRPWGDNAPGHYKLFKWVVVRASEETVGQDHKVPYSFSSDGSNCFKGGECLVWTTLPGEDDIERDTGINITARANAIDAAKSAAYEIAIKEDSFVGDYLRRIRRIFTETEAEAKKRRGLENDHT